MRTILFYGIIICLLFGGGYFMYQKIKGGDSNLDFAILESNEVAPKEQWKEILVGKWNFVIEIKNNQTINEFKGDLEYKPDGTFEKFLTHKCYGNHSMDKQVIKKQENLDIVAGGSVRGQWKVNDNMTWEEKFKKCSLDVSYTGENGNKNYNPCDYYFTGGDSKAVYGNETTDDTKMIIKTFSKNKIKAEAKTYSDEGITTYIWERIK